LVSQLELPEKKERTAPCLSSPESPNNLQSGTGARIHKRIGAPSRIQRS
jgi:hypothetical protein